MLPITPLNTSYRVVRKCGYRYGYRQARPFNLNLPYKADHYIDASQIIWPGYESWGWGHGIDFGTEFNRIWYGTYNKAYSKFKDQLGEASQLGATLTAEGRETSKLLTSSVLKILGAARAATRGRFMDAFRILGYPVTERTIYVDRRNRSSKRKKNRRLRVRMRVWRCPDNGRYYTKSAANGWLLWSYGVKPLASDIYNSLDVLSRSLPHHHVVSAASGKGIRYGALQEIQSWHITEFSCRHRLSADVTVRDASKWLLNRWGLDNPAQWVLEGIRLSFVLDWFTNLSDVVESWMDFNGLDITNIVYTHQSICREAGPWIHSWTGRDPVINYRDHTRKQISRTLPTNLAPPKLLIAWERVHWQRGLNAISLLIGLIKSGPNFKRR